jgi:ABC-type transporter Mla MlaB component
MTRSAPLSSDLSQEQVEAMMEQGMAFSDVEDLIDVSQLSALHKAALWLLAWSLRDVEHQREDARLTLAAVGAGELGGW